VNNYSNEALVALIVSGIFTILARVVEGGWVWRQARGAQQIDEAEAIREAGARLREELREEREYLLGRIEALEAQRTEQDQRIAALTRDRAKLEADLLLLGQQKIEQDARLISLTNEVHAALRDRNRFQARVARLERILTDRGIHIEPDGDETTP
jgi:predicted nuclease with TOPRIM domain